MKKKLFALALAGVMAMGVISCGADGNNSDTGGAGGDTDGYVPPQETSADTFIGVESATGYDSMEKSAKAYFDAELAGQYVDCKSVGELTSDNIKKLGLSSPSDVKSATVVEVLFKRDFKDAEQSAGVLASAYAEERTLINTAYAIEYNDGTFKYFSPRPGAGESVTKSYFAALVDGESYVNCKMTETFVRQNYHAAINDPESSQEESYMRYEDSMKLAVCADRIEYEMTSKSIDLLDPDKHAEEEKSTRYDVRRDDTVYSCASPDNEWSDFTVDYPWSEYIFDRVFEASWVRYLGQYYFYLEKTENGFKATDDYYKAFGFKYKTKSRNAYCEVKN